MSNWEVKYNPTEYDTVTGKPKASRVRVARLKRGYIVEFYGENYAFSSSAEMLDFVDKAFLGELPDC